MFLNNDLIASSEFNMGDQEKGLTVLTVMDQMTEKILTIK